MSFTGRAMRLRGAHRLTEHMTASRYANEHEDDEQALLDAARAGDERALGLLLHRHRSGLELCCYLMLGDRAKARAALADTALAAWDARGAGGPTTSARMWLYRLALRVCAEADAGSAMSFVGGDRLTGEKR
jgi:DNA-directed RNA polymerase specialized sigma24 family protein